MSVVPLICVDIYGIYHEVIQYGSEQSLNNLAEIYYFMSVDMLFHVP